MLHVGGVVDRIASLVVASLVVASLAVARVSFVRW